jgi:hypothetical protein
VLADRGEVKMTEAETRTLKNQIEIMWTLHYILRIIKPDLIGHGGELDRIRDDLLAATRGN